MGMPFEGIPHSRSAFAGRGRVLGCNGEAFARSRARRAAL